MIAPAFLARPSTALAAPILAAAVALALRLAGQRFDRPVPRFAAGAAALIAGWGLLQGVAIAPRNLAAFAAAALLAAAMPPQPHPKPAARRPAPARAPAPAPAPIRVRELQLWIALLALFGGWWLAGGGLHPSWPGLLAGAAAIAATTALARDPWSIAAAALCLWAALSAIGAAPIAPIALVAAAACLGSGPVLPLAAGLGAAIAAAVNRAQLPPHHLAPAILAPATLAAAAAPLLCVLLILWWRHRFNRFGRVAAPIRAAAAAALVCLLAFSAAAMQGLR